MDTTADAYLYAGVRMMNWGDVPTWVQAGSTIVLVGITTYYAIQNRVMATELRRQTRMQLYDRRAAILRGVGSCLALVMQHARVRTEVLPCLFKAMAEKEYLLDAPLCAHLDDIFQRCVEAYAIGAQIPSHAVGSPTHAQLLEKETSLIIWLTKAGHDLGEKFRPYLAVEG
jgi:hypothetical protein